MQWEDAITGAALRTGKAARQAADTVFSLGRSHGAMLKTPHFRDRLSSNPGCHSPTM